MHLRNIVIKYLVENIRMQKLFKSIWYYFDSFYNFQNITAQELLSLSYMYDLWIKKVTLVKFEKENEIFSVRT
jgi:hypothetical protein